MTWPGPGNGAPPVADGARVPRALTIASSDSGGGAGIQADLKAFARCGAHGMSAIVALTAQNTLGVSAIHEVPPDFARAQIDVVLDDLGADAVKTGMLFSAPLIEAVAGALASRGLPLVVNPVMVASSGSRLLREDAVKTLITALFPLATVVTPNLPEAQALTGLRTEDRAVLAEALAAMGAPAVLVTGGHGREPEDHLFDGSSHLSIPVPRYPSPRPTGPGAPTRRRSRPAWPPALPCPARPGRPPPWPATRSARAPGSAPARGPSTPRTSGVRCPSHMRACPVIWSHRGWEWAGWRPDARAGAGRAARAATVPGRQTDLLRADVGLHRPVRHLLGGR